MIVGRILSKGVSQKKDSLETICAKEVLREIRDDAAKIRKDEWLRENIDSEIDFAREQRKLWQSNLDEAIAQDDKNRIFKIKRDLEYNANRITNLLMKKKELLMTPPKKFMNDGR